MKDFENTFKDGGSMKTLTTGLDRYIDYDVTDSGDNKVGTLNSLWVDRDGHPLFLGIKTGWVFGKTHVVPTDIAKVDQPSHRIQLPISEDTIKGAPAFDADKGLDVSEEREVYRYFHIEEPAGSEGRLDLASPRRGEADVKVPTAEAVNKPLEPPKPSPMAAIAAKGAAAAGAAAGAGTAAKEAASSGTRNAGTAAKEGVASTGTRTESQAPSAGFAATGTASQPWTGARAAAEGEEGKMALCEESLKVGKKIVDAGGVRLRKVIRTETVSQPVELSHEEIVIERVPISGPHPGAAEAFAEKEVYIMLHREEPVVQKESRVREEVRARKQPQIEKRTVSDSIRKEDVEVVKDADEAARFKPKSK